MKIFREVGGASMEFELTSVELYDAFCEQEHLYDRADIEAVFNEIDDDEILDGYGFTRDEIKEFFEDMAHRKRHYMDKYALSSESAVDEAINRVIDERKAMKQ